MRSNSRLRPAGQVIITDPEARGGIIEADTLQCVHCGCHWQVKPMSRGGPTGTIRGFCHRCNGPICGPRCIQCVPQEKRLELMEEGITAEQAPVKLFIPTAFPS